MKKNIAIIGIVLAAAAQSAFANGVEKTLPADATDVQIKTVSLDQYATGEKIVSDGNVDGPVYENTYTTMLDVVVTYQSKDDQDVAQRIEGESDISYDPTPTVSFELPVTDAEIAAIKGKKLDPRSLIAVNVQTESVQIDDPKAQYICRYDNDSNQPLDGCVEPATPQITVSRLVLSVDRK